jgi:hypothetical protein
MLDQRDRPDLTDVVIAPAMLEAGVEAFKRWFECSEHQESLVELPSDESISELLLSIVSAMSGKALRTSS